MASGWGVAARNEKSYNALVADHRTLLLTASVSATFGGERAGFPVGLAGGACRGTGAIDVVAVGEAIAVLIRAVGAVKFRNRWRAAIQRAAARVLTRITEEVATAWDDRIIEAQSA